MGQKVSWGEKMVAESFLDDKAVRNLIAKVKCNKNRNLKNIVGRRIMEAR